MNELFESSCLSVISEENDKLRKEIERLNNDIKVLLKENENKEKVIKAQDNIIKEVREELNKIDSATYQGDTDKKTYYKYEQTRIQKLLEILDKVDKENNKTNGVMSVEELESYEPKNMAEQEYQDWFWD